MKAAWTMFRRLLSNRRYVIVAFLAIVIVAGITIIGWNRYQNKQYAPQYTDEVTKWSTEYAVDPYLVYAVIHTESSFRSDAESSAGARGLMQMTSDTFDWVKGNIAPDEALTFDDLYDPNVSIRFGTYYLARCLARYGQDVSTAAAAYHSGWGTVDKLLQDGAYTDNGIYLTAFPYRQMNHYVAKINESYQKYITMYS